LQNKKKQQNVRTQFVVNLILFGLPALWPATNVADKANRLLFLVE